MTRLPPFLFVLFGILPALLEPAFADEKIPASNLQRSSSEKIRQIISEKIDYYNRTYPEIHFVQVEGGQAWHGDMVSILAMLGTDAMALDYQHPPHLRNTLLEVTLGRLKIMLRNKVVSATLFRVGHDSPNKPENLCVITLNPQIFVVDDYQATRYMLGLKDDVMRKVHPARYLNHLHHLEFTLHHEAFHCLDSFFNGGAPQTFKELGGEYNVSRRESISDAYAMAMHLREHGDKTPYARNIVHFRALWIAPDTHSRCTFETIREVLNYDYTILRSISVRELVDLVTHIRNRSVGEYDTYVINHVATNIAAGKTGVLLQGDNKPSEKIAKDPANVALVHYLVNRFQYYYAKLFTDEPILLEAPHEHDWSR